MRNDTCKQHIPGSSVADVVFAFTRCFHRHLDLCGMFDRPLCRKIIATYMLRRKRKIATHDIPFNVESTSLTTTVFDLDFAVGHSVSASVRRGYLAFFFQ